MCVRSGRQHFKRTRSTVQVAKAIRAAFRENDLIENRESDPLTREPPHHHQPPVWLIGASVRALAQSARRSHFRVSCSDLFADIDTTEAGECTRMDSYPNSVLQHASAHFGRPIVITGGLENYPRLLESLSESNPLWCTPPEILETLKDPFALRDSLASSGLCTPEVRQTLVDDTQPGEWISKPLQSAGGLGIRPARPDETACDGRYFQRRVTGDSLAATFLVSDSGFNLLGVTRQLIGTNPAGGQFTYGGSIGPIPVSRNVREQLTGVGQFLRREGAIGLVGCDFIHPDPVTEGRNRRKSDANQGNPDQIHIIEFNPRYTQSMELIELAIGRPLFAMHAATFTERGPTTAKFGQSSRSDARIEAVTQVSRRNINLRHPEARDSNDGNHSVDASRQSDRLGKVILYAPKDILIREDLRGAHRFRSSNDHSRHGCWVADIPVPGQTIDAGDPICSMLWRCRASENLFRIICDRTDRLTAVLGVDVSLPENVTATFR